MNHRLLLGAAIGDVIGSYYEVFRTKNYDFPIYWEISHVTDDTVMTVANADWLLTGKDLVGRMLSWGRLYISAGYGGTFYDWLTGDDHEPYNSLANGSAMRVSPVGWAYDTLEETLEAAKESAMVTHSHPEGIKGAQATAACIFMARTGKNKEEIREYVEKTFGYNLHRSCDEIRPSYKFDVTCKGSVPESIICFLESSDFESAVRLAVSMGGDADTMAAITGGIAEAYYQDIPQDMIDNVMSILPEDIVSVLEKFYDRFMDGRVNGNQ